MSVARALAIVATVLGLHLLALNVLYPKLIGKRPDLNPVTVTIALLVWGGLWGVMGLIVAIPIVGVKVVCDHVEAGSPGAGCGASSAPEPRPWNVTSTSLV
jgi:predicted PurR-regulated permease PerM